MSQKSNIEWTDATWNPVTGCTKVSPGCAHCYAERITERFHGPGSFEKVVLHLERMDDPLRWKKPHMVFVNSMSDLFHEEVSVSSIIDVFSVMYRAPQHTFQILTKRPERMRDFCNTYAREPLRNVWMGVSAENQHFADERIPVLLQTPSAVRFLSCEPLLGPISCRWAKWDDHLPNARRIKQMPDVERDGKTIAGCVSDVDGLAMLDWVICGGESGPGSRPMQEQWARDLMQQCKAAGVAFFMKQGSRANWPYYKDFESFPKDLQVREYPNGASR